MYRIDTVLGHLHQLEERALLETCWPDAFQPRGCLEGNWPVVWVPVGPNSQRPTVAPLFESLAPAVFCGAIVKRLEAPISCAPNGPNAQRDARHWWHHNAWPSCGRGARELRWKTIPSPWLEPLPCRPSKADVSQASGALGCACALQELTFLLQFAQPSLIMPYGLDPRIINGPS